MGFAESLSTLAMTPEQRNAYQNMANSSDPAARQAAKEMINGGSVTPFDIYKTYIQSELQAKMKKKQEQLEDMERMIQNLTKDNPTYDSISWDMQNKLKKIYGNKTAQPASPKRKEENIQAVYDKFSDVLPEQDNEFDSSKLSGPEF